MAKISEPKITKPNDHQESPTHNETSSATPIPITTAPTRTRPIRADPAALAWITSSAVSAPVRSTRPSVTNKVTR